MSFRTLLVAGQLEQDATAAASFADDPCEQRTPQAAAATVGVDTDRFDLRTKRSPASEAGEEAQLHRRHHRTVGVGDEQEVGRVRVDGPERLPVRAESVTAIAPFPHRAQRVISQELDDARNVVDAGPPRSRLAVGQTECIWAASVPAGGPMDADVLVVGAGPAGLAVAACLRRRGVDVLVVDRGTDVGESWAKRYDRLHLHTPRVQSALPGLRVPRRFGRWVAKDDVAAYLREYAAHHGITPRFGTEVRRLVQDGDSWTAHTDGPTLQVRQVVIATGYNATPVEPDWPGQDSFPGEVRHASTYSTPAPYRGKDVLVVGAGNTGAEIAADLAESGAARVRVAVRTPPNVVPRSLGPVPTTLLAISMDFSPAWLADPVNRFLQRRFVGDLTRYGLPAPHSGVVSQMRATGVTPTIDVGLIEQLKAGRVTPVAALERFDGREAVLADGTRLTPDAVIAATGYTTGLGPVVGHLGVLDTRGRPLTNGARTPVPGLRFVGLSNPLKGLLLQINLDARATARAVARELEAVS